MTWHKRGLGAALSERLETSQDFKISIDASMSKDHRLSALASSDWNTMKASPVYHLFKVFFNGKPEVFSKRPEGLKREKNLL